MLDFLDGAQHNKNIYGWKTLHEFDNISRNKDFNFKVYKKNDRIVIVFPGTDIHSINDIYNDIAIMRNGISPYLYSQFSDAENLYNNIKARYRNSKIESTGYSLGGSLSNLLSHRTGIKSNALAPIGSKHVANSYPKYFKYDDSNITTYGRKGDSLFNLNINKQSGNIYIIPDLPKGYSNEIAAQHLLHNYNPYDISQAKITTPLPKKFIPSNVTNSRIINSANLHHTQLTGYAAPINYNHIFTPEEIGNMTSKEFEQNEALIIQQLKNGQIQNQKPQPDYTTFKNPESRKNLIFTREDIDKMSNEEFTKHEQEIMSQMNSVGIPYKNDLPDNIKTYEKEKSYSTNNKNGKWVTINGNHVFIED